jgi:hypothetical protein
MNTFWIVVLCILGYFILGLISGYIGVRWFGADKAGISIAEFLFFWPGLMVLIIVIEIPEAIVKGVYSLAKKPRNNGVKITGYDQNSIYKIILKNSEAYIDKKETEKLEKRGYSEKVPKFLLDLLTGKIYCLSESKEKELADFGAKTMTPSDKYEPNPFDTFQFIVKSKKVVVVVNEILALDYNDLPEIWWIKFVLLNESRKS